jgi:hypothetical protein
MMMGEVMPVDNNYVKGLNWDQVDDALKSNRAQTEVLEREQQMTYCICDWGGDTGVMSEWNFDWYAKNDPELEVVGTFDAGSWDEAMQMWYDYRGFGTYKGTGAG